jgi:hypothetical protein
VEVTILDTGCPDCNRRELALHTAQIEAAHARDVIAYLDLRVKELEKTNRDLHRRLDRK